MRITYTKDLLQSAVDNSTSVMGVLRYLGLKQAGGTHTHISRKIKEYEINTDHFRGQAWNTGLDGSYSLKSDEEILVLLPDGSNRPKYKQLKRAMLSKGLEYKCGCGNEGIWNNKPLTLEIDHIDGNWLNNLLENLRFICPNCHSQEETTNKPHKYRVE